MDDEIQLISDGDGLAVIGDSAQVERFMVAEGLSSTDLGLRRLNPGSTGSTLAAGAGAAQAGSEVAANSARWVKLTKESAELIQKHGLRKGSNGVSTGVVKGAKGQIKGFVEFSKGPGAALTNPALLAGAAGMMSQLAMQQTMAEITSYLAAIDEKVDDLLRAQKDAVLARMIGVGFVIDEAMILRENRGRVDEITWSKVQAAPATVAETQAYALRQLDALAEKLEQKTKIGDLVEATQQAGSKAQEWLAVLARCFQLQDAIAVLELDRVLDAAPDELDGHRIGLKKARQERLERISRCTVRLLARLDAASARANAKVLTHPVKSPIVVRQHDGIAVAIADFRGRLGLEARREQVQPTPWAEAVADVAVRARTKGADSLDAAKRVGDGTATSAKRLGRGTRDWVTRRAGQLPGRRADSAQEDGATET